MPGMSNRHKAAGIVGLAVMGSRILGLVREQVFAAMFGAGKFLDAFLAAFQIPNLLRDLFAEGALSTAFTTTFTKTLEKEGEPPAWHLASLLFSAMILLMGGICVVGIAASPFLVQVTNFGFHTVPGKFELAVTLTRILFPFILLVSLASVVMGILNARFIFGLPASASTVFNLVSVISGVLLAYAFDPQSNWRHPNFSERALYGVTLGVLLGGLAQLGMQVPSLWKLGYRSTVGLVVLAPDIIRVIYEHGHFNAADTMLTADALRAFSMGLCGYAAIKVMSPCFYALDRRRTPLMVSVVGIGICLAMNFLLVKGYHMGHVGLAATTGLVALLNSVQLAVYLRRDIDFGSLGRWFRFAVRVGVPALACGLTLYFLKHWLSGLGQTFPWLAGALAVEIAAGGAVYIGLTWVFRIHETHDLADMIRRKLTGAS